MLFNSLTYLCLLLFVVISFWNLSGRSRFFLIFISSLTFYGFWKIEFIILLLFSTISDWLISHQIVKYENKIKKKFLLLSLIINLSLLFYFKYLIFFSENTVGFLNLMGLKIDPIVLKIILPLGISFYTFQTISYTVDVYRKVIKPEKDFIVYACYVTFFPQLVAGPILRAREVISQFKKKNDFNWNYITNGFRRVLYGLFLKVVLADNIAPLVNTGFNLSLETLSAIDVWTLAFLFGLQIYFDFSGYSHIALGSAKMIGISFPENFNFPYLANSPKDFWQRWHISLSSWVRDYIYLPLLGVKYQNSSKGGLANATLNKNEQKPLFITWGLMGLWHGANWTFILWGLYHSLIIFIFRKILIINQNLKIKVNFYFGWLLTLPLMMLSWIPFRAESINDTITMWGKVLNPLKYNALNLNENIYLITLVLMLGVIMTSYIKNKIQNSKLLNVIFINIGDTALIALIFYLTFIFLRPINQFIYFQF